MALFGKSKLLPNVPSELCRYFSLSTFRPVSKSFAALSTQLSSLQRIGQKRGRVLTSAQCRQEIFMNRVSEVETDIICVFQRTYRPQLQPEGIARDDIHGFRVGHALFHQCQRLSPQGVLKPAVSLRT